MCFKWVEKDSLLDGLNFMPEIPGSGLILNKPDLLISALESPKNHLFYSDAKPTIFDLSAIYVISINKNHAFVDGNKRASYCAVSIFLDINGYKLTATHQERTDKILDIAAGNYNLDDVSMWFKNNCVKKKLPLLFFYGESSIS